MKKEQKTSVPKAEKTTAPKVKTKARPTLPGQRRFGTVNAAINHVSETLGMLHIQAHDNLKGKR